MRVAFEPWVGLSQATPILAHVTRTKRFGERIGGHMLEAQLAAVGTTAVLLQTYPHPIFAQIIDD